MVDPLAEVVTMLAPGPDLTKVVSAAGRWHVRRAEAARPFFCAVTEGSCALTVEPRPAVALHAGDFVLIPAASEFTTSSLDPPRDDEDSPHVTLPTGEVRHGDPDAPADVRMLVGYCAFGSPDAGLLVPLLPQFVHVRGEPRLAALVELVGEESRHDRPARDVVLARLLEVLLIEALRSTAGTVASPGLVRGLADERISIALRRIHERPDAAWTVAELAREAALSRSAFFARFERTVGMAPMAYLLHWRMALAKDLLRDEQRSVTEVARRVGYSSGSTFSVAFTRHVGVPPTHYARHAEVG